MTLAEVLAILARTRGQGIVARVQAVHGSQWRQAFRGGDWRAADFRGQDLRGISFAGAMLFGAKWDGQTQVDGCDFSGAFVARDILKASGIDQALWDEDQTLQIRRWRRQAISTAEYANLIRAAPDFNSARRLLLEMEKAGFPPVASLVALAIGKTRLRDDGDAGITDIAERFLQPGSGGNLICNSVIAHAFERATGDSWFNRLETPGMAPDIFSWNGYLKHLTHDEQVSAIRRMRKAGIEPTEHSWFALVKKATDLDKHFAVLALMQETGIRLDTQDFHQCFWRARSLADVDRIRALMAAHGCAMDQESWSRAIMALGNFGHAMGLWAEMLADGVRPDRHHVKALFRNVGTRADFRRALQMAAASPEPLESGPLMDALTYMDSGQDIGVERDAMDALGVPKREQLRRLMIMLFDDGAQLFDDHCQLPGGAEP